MENAWIGVDATSMNEAQARWILKDWLGFASSRVRTLSQLTEATAIDRRRLGLYLNVGRADVPSLAELELIAEATNYPLHEMARTASNVIQATQRTDQSLLTPGYRLQSPLEISRWLVSARKLGRHGPMTQARLAERIQKSNGCIAQWESASSPRLPKFKDRNLVARKVKRREGMALLPSEASTQGQRNRPNHSSGYGRSPLSRSPRDTINELRWRRAGCAEKTWFRPSLTTSRRSSR